jgi:hypothetical protein
MLRDRNIELVRTDRSGTLRCLECDVKSPPRAIGWKAYLGGGHDLGELEIGIYCPSCAHSEFG